MNWRSCVVWLLAGFLPMIAAQQAAPEGAAIFKASAELGDLLSLVSVTLRMQQSLGSVTEVQRQAQMASLAGVWIGRAPTDAERSTWSRAFDAAANSFFAILNDAARGSSDPGRAVRILADARAILGYQRGAAGDLSRPLTDAVAILDWGQPQPRYSSSFQGVDQEVDALLTAQLNGLQIPAPQRPRSGARFLSPVGPPPGGQQASIFDQLQPVFVPGQQPQGQAGGNLGFDRPTPTIPNPVQYTANAAQFLREDGATQGNWKAAYGSQGALVVGDRPSLPSWAAVAPGGTPVFTWADPTTDARALEKIGGGRTAATWYSFSVMSVDVNLSDGQPHRLAVYALDWDYAGGRSQRVEVLDAATSAVLDTRTLTGFQGGKYLVWNVRGHVILRITNLKQGNAVIGGVFIGSGLPASRPGIPGGIPNPIQYTANAAQFLREDGTTQGNWKAAYGSQGALVVGDRPSLPSWAAVAPDGTPVFTWADPTTDARALEKIGGGRTAAAWYTGGAMSVDVNLSDGQPHQLAVYALDWDNWGGGRNQRVEVLDAATSAVLDTRTLSGFQGGKYLVWNVSGHVILRTTNLNQQANAVIGSIFIGPGIPASGPAILGGIPNPVQYTANAAQFLREDGATQGNWKAAYGSQGALVVGDRPSLPSWAAVAPTGAETWSWAESTTDARALEKIGGGRTAATWYSFSVMSVDVNLSDGQPHQLAVYALDWDYAGGRSQRVEVLDAATSAVLDTRTLTGFQGGKYLVWNVRGHVILRITNLKQGNAVIGGIFIGPGIPVLARVATNPQPALGRPEFGGTWCIIWQAGGAVDVYFGLVTAKDFV